MANEQFKNVVRTFINTIDSFPDRLSKNEHYTKLFDTVLRVKNNPEVVFLQDPKFRSAMWKKMNSLGSLRSYSKLRVWFYMRQIFPEKIIPRYVYIGLIEEGYSIERLMIRESEGHCSLDSFEECIDDHYF